MKNNIFSNFENLEIKDKRMISGGAPSDDTGTTQHIELCYGTTGLDGYSDPVYNDGTKGDWEDKDACKE